jgi:hypothetical protein
LRAGRSIPSNFPARLRTGKFARTHAFSPPILGIYFPSGYQKTVCACGIQRKIMNPKTNLSPHQLHALATASLGVIEAVEAGGDQGAPAGVVYAAMQAEGASFTQFLSLMGTLVRPGYLTLEDNCYRKTTTTEKLKAKLTRTLAALAGLSVSSQATPQPRAGLVNV